MKSASVALVIVSIVLTWTPVFSGTVDPYPRGVQWYEGSFDAALERAKAEDRLIVLDAWAIWCQFCREMDDRVWSRADVAASLAVDILPVKAEVDASRGAGVELGSRYGISSLPVVLVIEPENGSVLTRLEGFVSAEALVDAVEASLSKLEGRSKLRSGDPRVALQAAGRSSVKGRFDQALQSALSAVTLDPDCSIDAADDAALLATDLFARQSQPDKALALLEKTTPACRESNHASRLWSAWAQAAGQAGDQQRRGALLKERLEAFPDDGEGALEYAEWVLSNGSDEELAATDALLEKLTSSMPDDPRPISARSRVLRKKGDLSQALSVLETAIRLDPHDPELRELRLSLSLALRNR